MTAQPDADAQQGGRRRRERPERWAWWAADRVAVVDAGTSMTYGEWNRRADRLADELVGLDPGAHPVCVSTHQSHEWFVVNLALAKLGRDHVAIPWNATPADKVEMVRTSGARILITDDPHADELARDLAPVVRIVPVSDRGGQALLLRELVAERPGSAEPTHRQSQRSAPFVKYTSGTTGRPRGVRRPDIRTDDEARRRRESARGPLDLSGDAGLLPHERHRALITQPLHHGAGPRGARVCHTEGGTAYLLDRYDPQRALEIIDEHRITHWSTVPTMLQRMRDLPASVLARYDVGSLRMVAVGSAPTPDALKDWALDYFGDCLFEGYGASELGLVTLMPPSGHRTHPGSCGRLRPHVEVRVLDPAGDEVARGEIGELWIRTPVTIDRYVGAAIGDECTLTDDGFLRIGDYGRLDGDGYLYITGRAKDMIIRGGVNIFPAEIENVLADHPDVGAAAVIGVPDQEFGEVIAVYCEPPAGRPAAAADLAAFATARLAKHKAPHSVHVVRQLPRNDMGKVLKTQLRTRPPVCEDRWVRTRRTP